MPLRLHDRIVAQVEVTVGVKVEAVIAFARALALIDGIVNYARGVRASAVLVKVNRAVDRLLRGKGRIRFNLQRRFVLAFAALVPEKAFLAVFEGRDRSEERR